MEISPLVQVYNSVRGAVADQISEAVPAGGVGGDMAIGAAVEVIAGFADRAASQENTELTNVASDAVGGAVGSLLGTTVGQRASAIATKKVTQKVVGGAVVTRLTVTSTSDNKNFKEHSIKFYSMENLLDQIKELLKDDRYKKKKSDFSYSVIEYNIVIYKKTRIHKLSIVFVL